MRSGVGESVGEGVYLRVRPETVPVPPMCRGETNYGFMSDLGSRPSLTT